MGNDTSKKQRSSQFYEAPRSPNSHIPARSSFAPPPYTPRDMDASSSNNKSSKNPFYMPSVSRKQSLSSDDEPATLPDNTNRSAVGTRQRDAPIEIEAGKEDDLLLLSKFDTVFLVDDSGSMTGSRWKQAKNALSGVAEIATRYDADGVDVCFLNSGTEGKSLKSTAEVSALFNSVIPGGLTPTGERLEVILLEYMERLDAAYAAYAAGNREAKKTVKPLNLIVITDGAATDEPDYVIVQAAKRMDASRFPTSQVGIQFVQVGNDPAAAEALKRLDDNLSAQEGIRDMVDTVPFGKHGGKLTSKLLTYVLLGGINRRWDRLVKEA